MPWGVAAAVAGAAVSSALAPDAPGESSASKASADAANRRQDIADEQWARYKELYSGLESTLVDDSKNYGSIANKNEAARDAAAAVTSTYASLKDRLTKNPGINKNSQAYLNKTAEIGLAEAAQSATAQTQARKTVEDTGFARLKDAVGMGNGLQSTATENLAGAGAALGRIGSAQDAAAQAQYQADSKAAADIGKAAGGVFSNTTFQNWLTT